MIVPLYVFLPFCMSIVEKAKSCVQNFIQSRVCVIRLIKRKTAYFEKSHTCCLTVTAQCTIRDEVTQLRNVTYITVPLHDLFWLAHWTRENETYVLYNKNVFGFLLTPKYLLLSYYH